MRRAQHVGALRHEMDAAEDDELGVGVPADLARELEGVAGVVGERDHFVALVVMAEDHEPPAERRLRGRNAARHLLVGEAEVSLGQRLAFRDVFFLVRREDRNQHVCGCLCACEIFLNLGLRKSQTPPYRYDEAWLSK